MAYGWGTNEPVIKPIEEGGDNINQYALKIKDALDALYVELRQDIVRATLAEVKAGTDIKKIVTPAALKPILDGLWAADTASNTALQELIGGGTVYNASNLEGKSLDEVRSDIDATRLEGLTLDGVLAATVEGNLTANGWVKMANGLIIQWGTVTLTSAMFVSSQTVTLPTKFTAQNLWVMVGNITALYYDNDSGYSVSNLSVSSKTLTNFVISKYYKFTGTTQWLAIGY